MFLIMSGFATGKNAARLLPHLNAVAVAAALCDHPRATAAAAPVGHELRKFGTVIVGYCV